MHWPRSLYWRIALSFALFTTAMLVGQNLLFNYLRERPNPSFLSPNAMAMLVDQRAFFLCRGAPQQEHDGLRLRGHMRQQRIGEAFPSAARMALRLEACGLVSE